MRVARRRAEGLEAHESGGRLQATAGTATTRDWIFRTHRESDSHTTSRCSLGVWGSNQTCGTKRRIYLAECHMFCMRPNLSYRLILESLDQTPGRFTFYVLQQFSALFGRLASLAHPLLAEALVAQELGIHLRGAVVGPSGRKRGQCKRGREDVRLTVGGRGGGSRRGAEAGCGSGVRM